MKSVLAIVLLVVLVAGGIHFLGSGAGKEPRGGGTPTRAREGEEAARVPMPTDPEVMIERVEPRQEEEVPAGRPRVVFPDGTVLPNLNGVAEDIGRLNWPANRPYAPVIGIWNDGELDWYVHEDGCRSTTLYPRRVIRNGKEVKEAVGLVQAPAAAVPNRKFLEAGQPEEKLPVER